MRRGCDLRDLILANKEIGANQHLRMISGEERGSVADNIERLVQVEYVLGEIEKSLRKEMNVPKVIAVGHKYRGLVIQGVKVATIVGKIIKIINWCVILPSLNLLGLIRRPAQLLE